MFSTMLRISNDSKESSASNMLTILYFCLLKANHAPINSYKRPCATDSGTAVNDYWALDGNIKYELRHFIVAYVKRAWDGAAEISREWITSGR